MLMDHSETKLVSRGSKRFATHSSVLQTKLVEGGTVFLFLLDWLLHDEEATDG